MMELRNTFASAPRARDVTGVNDRRWVTSAYVEYRIEIKSIQTFVGRIRKNYTQGGFSTVSLPQIGTFVAAVDFRYLPECTFLDVLIYWCFEGHTPLYQYLKCLLRSLLIICHCIVFIKFKFNIENHEKMTYSLLFRFAPNWNFCCSWFAPNWKFCCCAQKWNFCCLPEIGTFVVKLNEFVPQNGTFVAVPRNGTFVAVPRNGTFVAES